MQEKEPGICKTALSYVMERRDVILLYFFTIAFFVIIGSLNHMENLGSLLYAAILTTFFWAVFGIIKGMRYVRRLKNARKAIRNLEQVQLLLSDQREDECCALEQEYLTLIEALCEESSMEKTRAREKETERKDYYLMWAHQIKTPIAAMRLLLNQTKESFPLQEELLKIEQYVEMALHFQRLESMSSDLVLGACNAEKLVRSTVKKFSVLFINKGLSLSLGNLSGTILTDEKWMGVCLEQILSNSIKYTKKGSISIYFSPEEPNILVIEDTGMGISSEDLPRIFERGFTGYNGRMDKKSTGIGLYLTKQILDRLGNSIRVESAEGRGTRVLLTMLEPETAERSNLTIM